MTEPFTYHDDGGDDLEPAEREVVCRYYLETGPRHTEFVTQFLGPSECGKFDVLWEESDLAHFWRPQADKPPSLHRDIVDDKPAARH